MSDRISELRALLTSADTGNNGRYGEKSSQAIPLAFDRINEGRPFSSTSSITRLPVELVWQIVKVISTSDLANFALVNRDCRQLARSRQFASVTFDYSNAAVSLLEKLLEEKNDRSLHDGRTQSSSIGACIRRITIETNPKYVLHRHDINLSKVTAPPKYILDRHNIDPSEATAPEITACYDKDDRLEKAASSLFDSYFPTIFRILSDPRALPNLDTLRCLNITLDKLAFESLISSNVQRLILKDINVDDSIDLTRTKDECRWCLKSLHIDVRCRSLQNGTSSLFVSLLDLAAPSLETLSCNGVSSYPITVLPPPGDHHFPKLHNLKLDCRSPFDPLWLERLVKPGVSSTIRSLDIDAKMSLPIQDWFTACGQLPRLETLVLNNYYLSRGPEHMPFLRANPQIRKLMLRSSATSDSVLENELLPLFRTSFTSLTSLKISWNADAISKIGLDQLSQLTTLEQLWLGAGRQGGARLNWEIDHDALQECVRHLPRLRKLAFSYDTYKGRSGSALFYYQVVGYLEAPARQHRLGMVAIADKYASILPNLDWILLGQLPMRIEQGSGGARSAVLLSEQLDLCVDFLVRLFGRDNDARGIPLYPAHWYQVSQWID